jgi:monoamine oxidase
VGAGFAGLAAAYELQRLGYHVEVFEARNRIGGRVDTLRNVIPGKMVEGGAELIGSNHYRWLHYKKKFGLTFTRVKTYENSPIRTGGKTLSFAETKILTREMTAQLKRLSSLAATIADPFEPWKHANAKRLDANSLAGWLRREPCSPECKRAIAEMLTADNGVPAASQSLLGVLAMVKGGGLGRYWTDTEVFRCKGGAQQLAQHFRAQLDEQGPTVMTSAQVKSIERKRRRAAVLVWHAGREIERECDDVILAIPPSVWRTIKFKDRPLSSHLRRAPQLGVNVKFLMRLQRRFWEDFASSPTLTEDNLVNLTWETTEQDPTGDFAMVAFSGADTARYNVRWPTAARRRRYAAALDTPYPRIAAEIKRSRFVNWPKDRWSRGSYYFPRLGEVRRWGPFWNKGYGGWLHFAGEHTCFAFVGYMEGALASGCRAAYRLAVRDGVLPSRKNKSPRQRAGRRK